MRNQTGWRYLATTSIVDAKASTAAYLEDRQQEDSEKSVVVRIDRIGQRWLDTLQCIITLCGVMIRSLDETEGWTPRVPHRRPGADGQADEGRRSIGAEDRADPRGQRKDGAERPEGRGATTAT